MGAPLTFLIFRYLVSTYHPSHAHSHQPLPVLPHAFFCRPAELVAPELIGCLLVKSQ
jgi:hypothetical protein